MLNAFSRDIRTIRAQENIGVHLGSLARRTFSLKKVTLAASLTFAAAPAAWRCWPRSAQHSASRSRRLVVLFRLPRENAAGDYKCGTGRNKQRKLNLLWHDGVPPCFQHHSDKGYRYHAFRTSSGSLAMFAAILRARPPASNKLFW